MNIYASDLRESIIQPCLNVLGQYSRDAENLLVGTAMQASSVKNLHCTGLSQRGLGIYHITPEKHWEIWDKYLIQFPDLASTVRGFASQKQFFNDPHGELISNLNYATVIAWMIYCAAGVDLTKAPEVVKAADLSNGDAAANFTKEVCNLTNINKPLDVNSLAQLWALNFDNGTGCTRNTEDFIATYRNPTLNLDCRKMVA